VTENDLKLCISVYKQT